MKKLYISLLTFFILLCANAQWSQLTSHKLSSVEFNGIVYTGTSIIIATDGGIFRSTDNGDTWDLSVNGMSPESISVWDVTYVDNGARKELWAIGNNIYKSTDDGLTWNSVSLTGIAEQGWTSQIARIGDRLVIPYSYFDGGLGYHITRLCYSDNGTTWSYGTLLGKDDDSYWEFIDYDNDNALYLVEFPRNGNDEVLWISDDATTIIIHPLTGLDANPDINDRSFTINEAGTNLFFCDENTSKYYRYDPGTEVWNEKINGISSPGLTLQMLFKLHYPGSRLFGTTLFTDLSSNIIMKLFYSDDLGDNWAEVSNPGVDFPLFEGYMVLAGGNRIITEVFNSTLAYSDNDGETWILNNNIYSGEFENLTSLSNGDLYTYSLDQEKGILMSSDNGVTWTEQSGDLINFQGIYLLNNLTSANDILYVSAAADPFTEDMALYKSINYGLNWTELTTAPSTKTQDFVGFYNNWPIYHFYTTDNDGTYRYTLDEGSTWINLSAAITPLLIDKVLGFSGYATNLLLFSEKNGDVKIYYSTDSGVTFPNDITTNLDGPNIDILFANRNSWDVHPSPIAAYKMDGTMCVLAAHDYNVSADVFFYKLNETADGWDKIGTSGLSLPNMTNFLSLSNKGGVWYLVSSVGTYASVDDCETWLPVWENVELQMGLNPQSFVNNDYGLFVGTKGTGIWQTPITVPIISTTAATDITETSALSGATILSTGGLPFGDKGLCWATHSMPTVSDDAVYSGASWESFTNTIAPLTAGTQYYVRALVYSPKDLVYGDEITFTTDVSTSVKTENNEKVLIFPNPSDGNFSITTEGKWMMNIFDAGGKVILTRELNPGLNNINLPDQPAGVYLLQLTGDNIKGQSHRLIIR